MTFEVDSRAPARPKSILVGAGRTLVAAVVTTLIRLELAHAARRHKSRGSPLPASLRRDVGLPPELPEPRSHWDYR